MASRSKYYYLKLKENFFDSEEMKVLESMENGYIYSNILMKMYLLSLKNEGKLIFKDTIPYNETMLSTVLNHNVDNVRVAISIFENLGLIEKLDSGAIFMLDIQNFIGKSSDEADRKREYRQRIEQEQTLLLDKCPDNSPTNCSNIRDRDRDRDRDRNIYSREVDEIVDYLNDKLGANYKKETKKTRDLIKARLKENFTVEDFKKVIDNKYFEWYNTEQQIYLRPETLFGTKFESYLNQKTFRKKKTLKDISLKEIDEEMKKCKSLNL